MMAAEEQETPRKRMAWSGLMLTLGGFAAAFSVAACCALPLLFLSLGLGTAWLTTIALIAVPYRGPLLLGSALALIIGAGLLLRQQRIAISCKPGQTCASPSVRLLTLAVLVTGAVLLWAGYTYV